MAERNVTNLTEVAKTGGASLWVAVGVWLERSR